MPVSPARAAAFDILLRVERESSYASELLHATKYESLSAADHALTTELAMGVLRWRSWLDTEIARASSLPLTRLDLEVVLALRLALYQFRWLDRIPQRAALHESVELIKRAKKRSAAPFVNAVLRKFLAGEPKIEESKPHLDSPEAIANALAHPLWMVERWTNEYGLDPARAICEYDQRVPVTAVRLRAPEVEAELVQEGITFGQGILLTCARRIIHGDITRTQAFRIGKVVIQDEASQLVAALVASASALGNSFEQPPTGRLRILDCCAAPGGKTLAITDHNPNASVAAIEIHPHRARLMQRVLSKSHSATSIPVVIADARHLPTSSLFDRVLVDVPCSGTGTLARNPEIKWRLTHDGLNELQSLQIAILHSAMNQVAPGGTVIYSTCSLEREENEDVIEQVLEGNSSFRLRDCRLDLEQLKAAGELAWSNIASLTRGPYLRTLPGVHPCDGFFAALLERV
jgi:16S rRNA (cytosine967-C5)-methyltransferase